MGNDIQELLAPAHLNRFGLDSFRLKGSGDAIEFYNLPIDLGEKALKIGAYEINDIQFDCFVLSDGDTFHDRLFSPICIFAPSLGNVLNEGNRVVDDLFCHSLVFFSFFPPQ
jgi:hypothetical protein